MILRALLALAAVWLAAAADPPAGPVLFILAHPDDEIIVAPLIAGLARRGVPALLTLVTAGERGAPADGSIVAGPGLGAIRRIEATCSAAALGIGAPIFLGLEDGSLGEGVRPPDSRLRGLAAAIATLIAEQRPRAIVTWGPEGGYGHPDHRLVGAVVSGVVLGSADGPPLLYPGLPADALAAHPPRMIAWSGVDRTLLTTVVAFTAADAAASRTAALCHHSQFASPAIVDALIADLEPVMAGAVHLRPARALTGDPFP